MMRFVLLGVFFCSQAMASCLVDWSGLYWGANAGCVWGSSDVKLHIPFSFLPSSYFVTSDFAQVESAGSVHLNPKGFSGGLQAGYNKNFCSLWLLGIETDFGTMLLRKSHTVSAEYISAPPTRFTVTQKVETNWLYTLRMRLGYTYKKWLAFVTGGGAWTEVKYKQTFFDNFNSIFIPTFPSASEQIQKSQILTGWTLGTGLEYALSSCLSANLTYLYSDFGHFSSSTELIVNPGPLHNTVENNVSLKTHIVRLGLNWRL